MVKPVVKKIEEFGYCSDLNRVENCVKVSIHPCNKYVYPNQTTNKCKSGIIVLNQINLQTKHAVNIENLYQKKRASCYLLIY